MRQYDTTPSIYACVKRGRKTWQQHQTCRLVVSVGRPNHEGEKLDATIQWVNENYRKCIFVLCDVLHRHNYMAEGFSPKEAYAMSQKDGDLWLERNREKIENLNVPYSIIRWEHCLSHEEFFDRMKKVKRLYDSNVHLRTAIRNDIDRFIRTQRKNRHVSIEEETRMQENGKELLLEEIAGCSIIIEETEAVDVYPGSEIKAVKLFREDSVPLILPSLKKRVFARLDFSAQTDKQAA